MSCHSLPQRGNLPDPYVKVCADMLSDLDAWASTSVSGDVQLCGSCHASPREASVARGSSTGAASTGRYLVLAPAPNGTVVEAWADDYIHYENEPDWQKTMRRQIILSCERLRPSGDLILHATFYGANAHEWT